MLFEWGIVGTSDESEQMMAEITKLQILPIEDTLQAAEKSSQTQQTFTHLQQPHFTLTPQDHDTIYYPQERFGGSNKAPNKSTFLSCFS
jgi:hypothetical protein